MERTGLRGAGQLVPAADVHAADARPVGELLGDQRLGEGVALAHVAAERSAAGTSNAYSTGRRRRVYLLAVPAWCWRRRRSGSVVQPQ